MDWDDIEEIAEQLSLKYPEIKDPFTIRFVELLQWVVNLEGFEGEKNPKTSMEGKLENIVQAWSDSIG